MVKVSEASESPAAHLTVIGFVDTPETAQHHNQRRGYQDRSKCRLFPNPSQEQSGAVCAGHVGIKTI